MEKGWLKNRLTEAKSGSPLWAAFAEALQTLWGEVIEGTLTRISDRKSFFTMDPEDMETRISEYGRFFTITEKSPVRRPLLLTQRLDEVHFKGTGQPLEQTFWREFGEMPVGWEPLYAPVDLDRYPYGSIFVTEDDISSSVALYGDFFLTSRGMILINLNELSTRYGKMDKEEAVERLLKDFDKIVAPLLPLHIVFDGVTLRLVVEFKPGYIEKLLLNCVEVEDSNVKAIIAVAETLGLEVEAATSMKLTDLPQERKPRNICWDETPVDAWLMDMQVIR